MALTREEWDREFFTSHVEYLSRIDRMDSIHNDEIFSCQDAIKKAASSIP